MTYGGFSDRPMMLAEGAGRLTPRIGRGGCAGTTFRLGIGMALDLARERPKGE